MDNIVFISKKTCKKQDNKKHKVLGNNYYVMCFKGVANLNKCKKVKHNRFKLDTLK